MRVSEMESSISLMQSCRAVSAGNFTCSVDIAIFVAAKILPDGIVQFARELPAFFILQGQQPSLASAQSTLRKLGSGARLHLISQ